MRQHPGPGTESLTLDARRLSLSAAAAALLGTVGSVGRRATRTGGTVEDRPQANGERAVTAAERRAAARRAAPRRGPPAPGPPDRRRCGCCSSSSRSRPARRRRGSCDGDCLSSCGAACWRRGREHGVGVWSLTAAGERALLSAGPQRLPESPRHLEWRRARTAAEQELPRFRARLAATLERAELMLAGAAQPDPGGPAGSGAPSGADWLELGRALAGDCRRLGSAWHCLHEWPEPEDAQAEPTGPERARLAALRNIRLWREPD